MGFKKEVIKRFEYIQADISRPLSDIEVFHEASIVIAVHPCGVLTEHDIDYWKMISDCYTCSPPKLGFNALL